MAKIKKIRTRLDEAITYGNFIRAKKFIQIGLKLAQKKEDLGQIAYFKAQNEIINENYTEAIKYLELAIKYNPKDGGAFNDLALCLVDLGNLEQAFIYFDKGIEVEPDYASLYHNKGWLLNKLGRYNEAIRYFQKALELEPKRSVTYENLAYSFVNLAKPERALVAYKKALKFLRRSYYGIRRELLKQMRLLQGKI